MEIGGHRQHGKFRYCSCMRWRMTSTEYRRSTQEERGAALEGLVRQGTPVGVLAYEEGEPLAWCSIAPRETYAALERCRALTVHRSGRWSAFLWIATSAGRESRSGC